MLSESLLRAMQVAAMRAENAAKNGNPSDAAYAARQIAAIGEISELAHQILQKYNVDDVEPPTTQVFSLEVLKLVRQKLSTKESSILEYFISNANRQIPYQELWDKFWGGEQTKRGLDNAIARIRKALHEVDESALLDSVYGLGFVYRSVR